MTRTEIDYRAVFQALPGPLALLTPDLVILDVNRDFLEVSGRERKDLIGRVIFQAFPANPALSGRDGQRVARASFERVLAAGARDAMPATRYDVEVQGHPGMYEERYWTAINGPVLGPDGDVILIMHKVQEITHIIRQVLKGQSARG